MNGQFWGRLQSRVLKKLKIIWGTSGKYINCHSSVHIIDETELNQLMKNFSSQVKSKETGRRP